MNKMDLLVMNHTANAADKMGMEAIGIRSLITT